MASYWQIASGKHSRDYADWFLKYGMAFVGGIRQIETIQYTIPGDVVVLKTGKNVIAAGVVVDRGKGHNGDGGKDWLLHFDGWKLPGYCFVDWKKPTKPIPVPELTRSTINRIKNQSIKDLADRIAQHGAPVQWQPEPKPTSEVADNEILKFLVTEGLRPGDADELTRTFGRIRLLANYYEDSGLNKEIKEHETRTFLIVPLLIALGWSEQNIKIELGVSSGKADIACFSKPYKSKSDDCRLILETKGYDRGLTFADKQAFAYAKDYQHCKIVAVTNGHCYKVYKRGKKNQFKVIPDAYLNLLAPTNRYPVDPANTGGCLDALKALMPK